jgi:acetyl esterase/lipase
MCATLEDHVAHRFRRLYRGRAGRWWCSLLATLSLAACSPATALNLIAATGGIAITRSIQYAPGMRRTLDIYRPRDCRNAPVIVFFYGGSWQSGNKSIYKFVGSALARRGYLMVVPDYRVYPEVIYPGFLDDGALAVRWTKDNAARFGGDPSRLFVMGHSAGAYIAAMLALDGRWLKHVGLLPDRDIAGLVGISGPYDFLPLRDPTLKTIFGGANDVTTQPIAHVAAGAPPALLVTGAKDDTVDPGNAARLGSRLRAAGDKATVLTYPWIGHLGIIGAFAVPLRFLAPVLRDVDAFVSGIAAKRLAAVDLQAREIARGRAPP